MTKFAYIKRAELVGDVLTSGDNQIRFREMTGAEAYFEFLQMVNNIPAADVIEVRPELRKAVKLLEENYERGLNIEYVHDPLAWALYQTWKESRC